MCKSRSTRPLYRPKPLLANTRLPGRRCVAIGIDCCLVLSRDGFVGRVERNLVSKAVAACEPSAECAYEGAIALPTLRVGGGLWIRGQQRRDAEPGADEQRERFATDGESVIQTLHFSVPLVAPARPGRL